MIKTAHDLVKNLAIEFTNIEILEEALTHRSANSTNNERLEFLGDAILGFVIADRIYSANDRTTEGDMSRQRAALVRKETLADIALEWDIGSYIQLGSGELKSGGFRRASILADTIEAIIGAVFKDQGLESAQHLITYLYGKRLHELDQLKVDKDPKSMLQEILQSRGIEVPSYTVLLEDGPAHKRHFEVACNIASLSMVANGCGRSRRIAEQEAARQAITLIEASND